MITLANELLQVTTSPKGAELTSIFSRATGVEHLWPGDSNVWGWHAPNLFPVVGGCLDNQLLVSEKAYVMERHGFARQAEFTVLASSPIQVTFSLRFNEQTLAVYPYRFDFRVIYLLTGNCLTVTYQVRNEDDTPVYFSVGGHPAFRAPFFPGEEYTDYYVEFDADKTLERHLLSPRGLFTGQTESVPMTDRKIQLTKDLFNQDALVFKNLISRQVTLRSTKHSHFLTVSYPPFNYLGIWAKPGAPFVCIEPWLGCADTEGKPVPIEQKEAIQCVQPGATFEAAFSIRVEASPQPPPKEGGV